MKSPKFSFLTDKMGFLMNQFWEAAGEPAWLRYQNHNQQEPERGPGTVQVNTRASAMFKS